MKIHIINLHLSRKGGGIFTVIKELYNAKTFKNYWSNKLIFWGFKDEFSKNDSRVLNGISNCFDRQNKFYYSREFKNKFINDIESNSIIHIHSLWMYPSILLLNMQKKYSFKKVVSPHGMLDSWALKNSKWKKIIALFLFEKRNLNSAQCVHALCRHEYEDIRKIAPRVPIAIIPNGIYLPDKIKTQENKEKIILFLGRLHPKKGLDNLIKAWSEIDAKDWKLFIVGPDEGGYHKIISDKINSSELKEFNVKIIDGAFGKEKEKLLLKSSVFILPSFSEGLPMSILEAWSFRLPVLMTKECNLEEGFKSHAAIQINSSIEGIKDGINNIINLSESERLDIGQKGYDLVKHKFTWDKVSNKVAKMYQWVNSEIDKPEFIILD